MIAPGSEFSGFRDRLGSLIGADEPFSWAKRAGIPSATFDRMWNGGVIPKAETLLRISRFASVGIDWLLTGDESIPPKGPGCAALALHDEELTARVAEAVAAVYQECGVPIGYGDLGRAVARICNEISAARLEKWDEKMGALRFAAGQLRRCLQGAVG